MSFLENRIPPPVLLLVFGIGMWLPGLWRLGTPIPERWRWILGGLLSASAIVSGGLGLRALRQARTTIDPVRPERASALVVTGIYRYTRNPMYVGFTLLLAGWAVFLGSAWALIGPLLFAAWLDRLQILPEERALRIRFETEFEQYARRVPRWL